MPEVKNQEQESEGTQNAYGSIKIAEEAVAGIVSLAAAEIKGVSSLSGNMTSGLTEILGKKNLSKGVKVEINDQEVLIALHIFVAYGVKIPQLALEIQNEVKDTVQKMTGLKVKEVNIYVEGISFENIVSDNKETIEEETEV